MTQFWFTIFNSFTGQSLYEEWTLALYNVLWTAIPIIIFAVLDEDVSPKTVMANPQLYRAGQDNTLFTLPIFARWVLNGLWMSCAVFFAAYFSFLDDIPAMDGKALGLFGMGLYVFTSMIVAVNLRLAIES